MPGWRGGSSGSLFQGGGSGRPARSSSNFGGDGEQLAERLLAEDLEDAFGGAGDGRRGEDGMAGGEKIELLLRMGQRVVRDQRGDVGQLSGFGAQKFAPRRRVEEEIGDGDGGAARQSCIFNAMDFAAGDLEMRSNTCSRACFIASSRFKRDARNGCD